MARQEVTSLIDDIDGAAAHETLSFGLDGVAYEIDVHSEKAQALRQLLAEFTGHARRITSTGPLATAADTPRKPGSSRPRAVSDPAAAVIRGWAVTAGVPVSRRGRIPQDVRRQYLADLAARAS